MNQCAPEVITHQLAWLPLRHSTRNRLGLLRRAIEQDWPKPEGAAEDQGQLLGRRFSRHYYAAYHGYTGEAGTEPFPKDLEAAAQIVKRLLAPADDASRVPEWGRQFGSFMRQRQRGEAKARPNLSFAIVLHGDEFLRRVESAHSDRARNAREKSHAVRHAARRTEYLAYLRLAERNAQQATPDLYATFAEQRARTRHAMAGGLFQASAETLAKFDCEDSRLLAFAECFRQHPQTPVLDLDTWDNQPNLLAKEALSPGERIPVVLSAPAAPAKTGLTARVGAGVNSTRVGTEP